MGKSSQDVTPHTAPVTAGTCEGPQPSEGQNSKGPSWGGQGKQNLWAFRSRGVEGGGEEMRGEGEGVQRYVEHVSQPDAWSWVKCPLYGFLLLWWFRDEKTEAPGSESPGCSTVRCRERSYRGVGSSCRAQLVEDDWTSFLQPSGLFPRAPEPPGRAPFPC